MSPFPFFIRADDNVVETIPVSVRHDEEHRLKNVLEASMKKLIFPLHLMWCVTFTPKYTIRKNLITPNNFRVKLLSGFVSFCIYAAYLYSVFKHSLEGHEANVITRGVVDPVLFVFNFIYICLGGIVQSEAHTELFIKIQKVQTTFGRWTKANRNILIGNWSTVGILYTFYIVNFIISIVKSGFNCGLIPRFLVMLTMDTSIIYVTRVLVLLNTVAKEWITEIKDITSKEQEHGYSHEDDDDNHRWMTAETSFVIILEAYNTFKDIAKFPIFFHTVLTFSEVLLNVADVIASSDYRVALGLSAIWITKNQFVLTVFCMECEKFYTTTTNAYVECLFAANLLTYPSRSRKLWKKIQRQKATMCKPLTACGLFVMDAGLPLRLLSAIVTYTVVLLQFSFK